MQAPLVSVNMSVYNGEKYLKPAIDSILNQTFDNFELIIVDDGSTDKTAEILDSYDTPRIRVLTQEHHGISYGRNQALKVSRGEFVAVMDADDISFPERLEKQVNFLQMHPEIGLLGTWARFADEIKDQHWEYTPPVSNQQLQQHLIHGNPFVHTSIMMRKSVLETVGGYNENFPYIVDYELFVRLAPHTQMANLPEVLVMHRYYIGSVSTTMRTELLRLWLRMKIRYRAFRTGNYPFLYVLYVLQPILFTSIEMSHKLKGYLKSSLHKQSQ